MHHEVEREHKVGGVDDNHAHTECLLRDGVVVVHCHHVGTLVGDEEQDIVHRIGHKLGVLLVCQFFDVLLHGVVVHAHGCSALLFVFGTQRIGVCGKGDLRIDDDTFAVRTSNHHVGAQFVAFVALETLLAVVFSTFAQPAVAQYLRQHLLAPVSVHFAAILQRVGKIGRLLADLLRLLLHLAQGTL